MKRILSILLCTILFVTSMGELVYADNQEEIPAVTGESYFGNREIDGLDEAKAVTDSQYAKDFYSDCKGSLTIPAQYRTPNLPPVRNQNPYGTCWAFSTVALGELSIHRQEQQPEDVPMDLSEYHLAYFSYNSVADPLGGTDGDKNEIGTTGKTYLTLGGNIYYSTQVLAGWTGLAAENDFPYSQALTGIASVNSYTKDVAHLQNAYRINIVENPDLAKEMIMKYGGLGVSYYAVLGGDSLYSRYYSTTNNAYYCCDSGKGTNHAVTIVGWDDTIPKEKFATAPQGDGAWVIRNSWGYNGESYSGYFYMSYYDKSLTESGYAYDVVSKDSPEYYTHNYQYDGCVANGWYSNENVITGANVFTSKFANEELKAVSFKTNDVEIKYDIDVYRGLLNPNNPESGSKVAEMTGKTSFEGIYTIPLDNYVTLQQGDTYSVVIRLSKPGSKVYIMSEYKLDSWYVCTSNAEAGQSFLKRDTGWVDIGKPNKANVRIKAYTNDITELVYATDLTIQGNSDMAVGESQVLSTSMSPANVTNQKVMWNSENSAIASVDACGKVTAKGAGTVAILATSGDGRISKRYEINVYIPLTAITLNQSSVNLAVGGKSAPLVVTFNPVGAREEAVTFTSMNENVAVIKDGCIVAVGPGMTKIQAKCGTLTATCDVYVAPPATEVVAVWNQARQSVTLTWKKIDGVTGYRILRQNASETMEIANCIGANTTSYEDTRELGKCTYIVEPYVNYANGTLSSTASAIVKYQISYVLNGGKLSATNPDSYDYTTPGLSIAKPTKKGYTFQGWYADANCKTRKKIVSGVDVGNLTLYAKWKANTYNIKFNANGATNGKVKTLAKRKYGTKYRLPVNSYKKKGYVFVGWNTKKNGKGKTYKAKAKIMNLTYRNGKTITLYAKWKKQ